jgi:hypothetical protein
MSGFPGHSENISKKVPVKRRSLHCAAVEMTKGRVVLSRDRRLMNNTGWVGPKAHDLSGPQTPFLLSSRPKRSD